MRSTLHAGVRRSGRPRRAACALTLAAALVSCGAPARPDPWPPGALFAGRGAAVAALLAQLAQLGATPLAREAGRLAAHLPDCPGLLGARAADGEVAALATRVRCLGADDPLVALRATLRSGAPPPDLLFALPLADGSRVRGTGSVGQGGVTLEIVWSGAQAHGPLALLLPGAASAGPDVLSPADRLLHLRVRPEDGLDLASLVPAGSQADSLFHLKSGLFASAVLDGTWEAAVYVPDHPGALPRAALALGIRSRSAALAAAARFLQQVEATWPVRHTPLHAPTGDGACLLDLNVLPELAPCYVATDRALVLGWNAASLRTALDAPPGESQAADPEPEAGALDVDLHLVERADALLAQPLPLDERPPVADWPWRRVRARGERRADDLVVHLALERAAS